MTSVRVHSVLMAGLVLLDGTFGHFQGKVVFGHTVEGTGLHVRGRCAFADDASDAETILEGPAIFIIACFVTDVFQAFGENQPFDAATFGKSSGTDTLYAFGKFEYTHQTPVVSKRLVADDR